MSIRKVLILAFIIVILGSLPINFINVDDEAEANYILMSIFFSCIGLGACGNLAMTTAGTIFPSMFTTEVFSCANIIGPIAAMMSPLIAEIPRPVPMLILLVLAFNGIIWVSFFTIPED